MTTQLTVTATQQRSPALRRVWFASANLAAFADSFHTDRYVKLVFPREGTTLPEQVDLRDLRRLLPPEELPVVRTYTALHPNVDAGTLAIDFVIHGDEGVAGPWAAATSPGDTLAVNGPGGAYRPDLTADWHLLVGDESAVPAISAAREELLRLQPGARVHTIVQVDSPAAHVDLPGDWPTTWVHRPESLAEQVRALEFPAGRVHAFVHGEAGEVMHEVRPHLIRERGIRRSHVSISGYWRRGRTEESFREWKAELAQAEQATGR
ncbi:MAG: siderophore-interacting protein [Actinomycetales bacterium]